MFSRSTAFTRVTTIAGLRPVHAAFTWLHNNPKTFIDRQAELAAIPAPPFGEEKRTRWVAERFSEIGLNDVYTDDIGNVFGCIPAAHLPPVNSKNNTAREAASVQLGPRQANSSKPQKCAGSDPRSPIAQTI